MADLKDARCECCGLTGEQIVLTMTFAKNGDVTTLCPHCERLIDAGILRLEIIEGRKRYRQWHIQPMTPGELIADPLDRSAT